MKKMCILSLVLAVMLMFNSCNYFYGDVSKAKVDYGKSEMYSKQDMEKAVEVIFNEFKTWKGCKLYTIEYMGDKESEENLDYCNDLKENKNFDECVVFESSFHSPKQGDLGFNPDQDYNGWTWYLARTNGGQWQLVTYGYG